MKGTGLRGALNGFLTVKNAVSTGSKGVQNFGLVGWIPGFHDFWS